MLLIPVYNNIAYPPMDNHHQPRIYEWSLSPSTLQLRHDVPGMMQCQVSVLISKSGEVFPLI